MQWAMSQDFVAICTTVSLTVIAVGTAFTVSFIRWALASDATHAELQAELQEGIRRLQKAGGTLDDHQAARRQSSSRKVRRIAFALGAAWSLIVARLLVEQIRMLLWSGAKEGTAGPRPDLAQSVVVLLSGTLVFLLVEAFVRVLVELREASLLRLAKEVRRDLQHGEDLLAAREQLTSSRQGPRGHADPVGRSLRALRRGSRGSSAAPVDG